MDIKPEVGHIPLSQPLLPPTAGKNFFKVELLVGQEGRDDHQLLLPFLQEHKLSTVGIDRYVATPGLTFSIRVTLERPSTRGTMYGARVYVDSTFVDNEQVFTRWSDDENCEDSEDSDVDTSKADHYFWIPEGESVHVIEGFYKSPAESQRFVFSEPSRKRKHRGEKINCATGGNSDVNKVGVIRIVFCKVADIHNLTREEMNQLNKLPQQASIDERLDAKIKLGAKPGRTFQDGCAFDSSELVLSNNIMYERRIVYNAFEGYCGRLDKYTHQDEFYKGMPLNVLLSHGVRSKAILAFHRTVSTRRVHLWQQESIQKIGQVDTSAPGNEAYTNDFVRVEDIVHFICQSLSPAASFIVCTGKEKVHGSVRNYGEKHVQNQGACTAEKKMDFQKKEAGLVDFFQSQPGTFELEFDGIDQTMFNERNYKVRLVVLELSSDDED